jgi:hypothetical protein
MADTMAGPRGTAGAAATSAQDAYAEHGSGWRTFAGVMLMLVGILNSIYGIAAISNSKFYVRDAAYVISDLNTWGWFLLFIGVIQFLAAFAIFTGSEIGRWIGIASASGNAIVQLFVLPANPFLALAVFAVDVLVIYGLVAHGGHHVRDAA